MWICNYLNLDRVLFEPVALVFFAIEAFTVIATFCSFIFLVGELVTCSSLSINLAFLPLLRLLVVAPQSSLSQ